MHLGRKKTLMERAHDYVEQVADTVVPQIESAIETAAEKAGPALNDARDRAKPLIAEGKAKAAEKAAVGATLAATGASLAAEKAATGRDLAAAKVAEIKGEPQHKGRGRLKKVLLIGGLLAIGGAIFSKLRKGQDSGNWQSSYVPTPPPGTPSTATSTSDSPGPVAAATTMGSTPPQGDPLTDPLTTDDVAGGDPGEAIADAAESPHPATTPDSPAEIIDVDDPQHK